ncbi:MAG: SdrD B-like domain-containing protein [Mariniblastus sp.]
MGLLKKLTNRVLGTKSKSEVSDEKKALLRRCYFEVMEERRVLSADPVIAAVTYLEGDAGQDTTPDHFEVSFQGGGDTTQMTQFTINGDQDSSGDLSDGDMFFDVNDQLPGTAGNHQFIFDAANSQGVSAEDITSMTVSDNGLVLEVEIDNFEAGDVFAFTIDVDEVERFRVDKIASGVEFEGSFFDAKFVDQNYTFEDRDIAVDATLQDGYVQGQFEGVFFDEYNTLFAEGESLSLNSIDLTRDNEEGNANRTAGAVDAYDLVPKPVTISGTIYHDEDLDCIHDANEDGIGGVEVQLMRLSESTGNYELVATTTTDADGNYEFGEDLELAPGKFQLVEIQPDGYLDVGASAGSEGGLVTQSLNDDQNVIADINIPLGGTAATDYDFKEVRPASIGGNVWHDANNDGVFDSNEQGIANVLIKVTRVGAKADVVDDPFADTSPIFVRTDANGNYEVDALPPGFYEIIEINEYPGEVDPLAAYIDGKDSTGSIDSATVGTKSNDKFMQIELCAGDDGVEYNFGEVQPAQLKGTVWHDANNDGVINASEDRIGNVVIELFGKDGTKIAETVTDAQGNYCFEDLYPGDYIVRESQPLGFIDGIDTLGGVNGITSGDVLGNDEFCVTLGSGDEGTEYNFGEIKSASISGFVHGDANGDCIFDPSEGDQPLAGVELVLLNSNGVQVGQTVTDANGKYSFDNLTPGTYSVREITPDGYLDGGATLGTVGGLSQGIAGQGILSSITVGSGDAAINYDFCEHIPADLCGTVYHDRNNNGVQDSGEEGIAGTRMVLTDENGNVIAETFTDDQGEYCFNDLIPGTYCVAEIQPNEFVDGIDSVGNVGGDLENDKICNIELTGGDEGDEYNFGELKLAEISGQVHVDRNGDCVFDPAIGERALADVKLELLDANGDVIATTMTDSNGNYSFKDILPGEYSIRETQPESFFNGGEVVGSGGGEVGENLIENIVVSSGQKLTNYDFCEVEAAEIHGRVWEDGPVIETEGGIIPDDYRSLRDGVYQASTDTPLEGVKMQLYYYIDPTSGSIVPRPVTLGEVQAEHYEHMGTTDPDAPVWVETMANGEYWFMGLQGGRYIVLETQPEGYVDSTDTPGTTQGFSFNNLSEVGQAPAAIISTFSTEQILDSVVNINLQSGGISQANNFSELRFTAAPVSPPPVDPPNIPPPVPPTPQPPGNPITPTPGITGFPGLAGSQPTSFTSFVGTSRGASFQSRADVAPSSAYTWHLSVVNGGLPRGTDDGIGNDSVWQQAGYISNADWSRFDMDDAVWTFSETRDSDSELARTNSQVRFGMFGGIPLAGDFDGDGTDELAVYKDGYWMIDINRNGNWDEADLLAKLGDADDRPVVGDWDGDGKDDIGIYGPIWELDEEAISRDPGLPNPDNSPFTKPKNVPPTNADATSGARIMKLTSYGKQRADVVDHVFGTGEAEQVPVTGDWNGNGIRSIGTFEAGVWNLDMNGDGRFDHDDVTVEFGTMGDIPVVGDFNGDGIEEIAVYRSGTWMIDTDGNRELDATDKTFQMGGAFDKPVVGDWDGDGVDEPAIYSEQANSVIE